MPGAEQSSTVCQQVEEECSSLPGEAGGAEEMPCEPDEVLLMSKSCWRGQTDWRMQGGKYREEKE